MQPIRAIVVIGFAFVLAMQAVKAIKAFNRYVDANPNWADHYNSGSNVIDGLAARAVFFIAAWLFWVWWTW